MVPAKEIAEYLGIGIISVYTLSSIRGDVVDKNDNYDDYADFDESKLWEVRILYFDKLFTIRRKYTDLFEISDDNYLDIHDLDDLGKIINIVGKHLKKINYEWRNIE